MFATIIRFIGATVGALVAFYFASHLVYAMGRMDAISIQNVDQFFAVLLKPISSLEWPIQKTMIVVVVAAAMQLFVLERLFRKWAYCTAAETRPLPIARREEPLHAATPNDYWLPSHGEVAERVS